MCGFPHLLPILSSGSVGGATWHELPCCSAPPQNNICPTSSFVTERTSWRGEHTRRSARAPLPPRTSPGGASKASSVCFSDCRSKYPEKSFLPPGPLLVVYFCGFFVLFFFCALLTVFWKKGDQLDFCRAVLVFFLQIFPRTVLMEQIIICPRITDLPIS